MNEESIRLYKLMIMYMLDKVNFPLSNNQISNFMLEKQYTNYFTLQESIHSLEEDEFIHSILYHNSTQYILTKKGKDTIDFFFNKISQSIRDDIDNYLNDNKYELKCEVCTTADYYQEKNGEYITRLKVIEGDVSLIEISLSVPDVDAAKSICSKWKNNNQSIYEYVIKKLL